MDWQATGDSWPGGQPDQEYGLPRQDPGSPARGPRLPHQDPASSRPPGSPAGFDHDGPWAEAAPSAALAVALERAAGVDDLYAGAETDALVGIARQWAAVESWAAAGKLAALRAMTREDAEGRPLLRRRSELPDGWDDNLTYEISGALAMGPVSAGNLAHLAWTLGTRLAGTGRLLAAGTLTQSKARLIAQLFEPLDDGEAARAEALILGELAGKTYPQVERLAWRAAVAVAPDIAERGRTAAEKHARVTVFREDSGAVGLSGRDLPAAEALAGHANVVARAREYQASGAFDGESTSRLEAIAYLDLLNGVSARDRITFAAGPAAEPPTGSGPDDEDGGGVEDPGGKDGGDGPHAPGGPGPDDIHGDEAGTAPGSSADGGDPGNGGSGPDGPDDPRTPAAPLAEVTVPLATLQGRAERAGDNRLLGPLDPALARDLAAAAARSPASRWEVIVVDEHGYAVGHGIARPARGTSARPPHPPPGPAPPGPALPARVSITITETYLRQLEAQAAQPRPGAPPPGDWNLAPGKPRGWVLTLPGGRPLAVRFDVVPTHDCDHRYAVSSYLPGDRLRRLIQVRDHDCTWPPCSRAARDSDFEHAVPYDKGGITDACNAGARSRRCHQVKQLPGWSVTQPKPGWHVWTTPTGRTYIQEPWQYTA
jgi:hypothetical protein